MSKKCGRCAKNKDLREFSKKSAYCRSCRAEYQREWSKNNRAKVNVYKAKENHSPLGRLKKAARLLAWRKNTPQPCSQCGSWLSVERHHHKGYDKQHANDIIFLCVSCHAEVEKRKSSQLGT